jgi:hypothetical protein
MGHAAENLTGWTVVTAVQSDNQVLAGRENMFRWSPVMLVAQTGSSPAPWQNHHHWS